MKKLLLVLCALLCALSLIACSAAAPKEEKLEGSLEDMIAKMYETVDVNDETRNWLQSYVANIPFTGEECAYYLGFDGAPITEGIASEPMMTSQAYSLCLMRVEEGTDIEAKSTITVKEKSKGDDDKDNDTPDTGESIVGISIAAILALVSFMVMVMCYNVIMKKRGGAKLAKASANSSNANRRTANTRSYVRSGRAPARRPNSNAYRADRRRRF